MGQQKALEYSQLIVLNLLFWHAWVIPYSNLKVALIKLTEIVLISNVLYPTFFTNFFYNSGIRKPEIIGFP
jgi:hypothetical protein